MGRGRARTGEQVRRSRDDLVSSLMHRVDFLLAHTAAFDAGTQHFAKAVAVDLRVLLLDSLLSKLRFLDRMPFCDSALAFHEDNVFPHHGLVVVGAGVVIPAFDDGGPDPRLFIPWRDWATQVVMSSAPGVRFTRKRLIQDVANLEGAHEDFDLPADYNALTRGVGLGYQFTARGLESAFKPDGVPVVPLDSEGLLPSPVPSAIRQIAHEVLVSLAQHHPEVFTNPQTRVDLLAHRGAPFGVRAMYMRRTNGAESHEPLDWIFNHAVDPSSLAGSADG